MPWKKVLIPVHGNDTDPKALRLACDLTRDAKGSVYLVYVIEVPHHLPLDSDLPKESSNAEETLHRMEELGKEYKTGVEAVMLQAREAGPAIVQEAVEREVDLILLALPYQLQHGSFSLGKAAPHVLKYAPCPVLLWRLELTPPGYDA
jgi:nucleotide-binding universal stress UspA family protein